MRLYISTLTKKFVQSASYQAPLTEFSFKRRDKEPIELYFLDEEGKITIPARFLGKAILVAGAHPEFNGKFLPAGTEIGKPIWNNAGKQIKRIAVRSQPTGSILVAGSSILTLHGKYLPDGTLNGKPRFKLQNAQKFIEWKPGETIFGSGVLLIGTGTVHDGLYQPDGTLNGKPRYRKPGTRISWKPEWESILEGLLVEQMRLGDVDCDGVYKRAATPHNGRPRYHRNVQANLIQIASSIQFESAYSLETEDAQGNAEPLALLSGSGGHFSVNLNGRFIKSTGNTIAGFGSGLSKWTIGNEDADIFSRSAGTYLNPYRLNLPDIGYTTSGSYLGGNNWYLDPALHNGQPQWYFGSRTSPLCVIRYDDPTNFKWRFIQILSGTQTTFAELTVTENDKNPIGKNESIVVAGAGVAAVNGIYHRNGEKNGKPKYSKADGPHIGWHIQTNNGVTSASWYVSTNSEYFGSSPTSSDASLRYLSNSNVATPDLATDWIVAGTPGTLAPAPTFQRSAGWTAIASAFNAANLNTAGGLKFDSWVISEDHWVLRTTKPHPWTFINSILTGDSAGGKPLAFALKNSTSFPASYAGEGDDLAWRSYANGSYGWETAKITENFPARWVARSVGTGSADGVVGWNGAIEFYTEDTRANVWETTGWKRSSSQPISPIIRLPIVLNPGRWLVHDENNLDTAFFEANLNTAQPYGSLGAFNNRWLPLAGGSAGSSDRQSTSFPSRWSIDNDSLYSATSSDSPWQASNWKNQDSTPSSATVSQEIESTPEHWGMVFTNGQEWYSAFDSPNSPAGAKWEAAANNSPPNSVTEGDHHAHLEGILAIKKNLLFDGPVLARSGEWVPLGNGFAFSFNLNTTEIDEAFDGEPESVDGMIELTWTSGDTITSSFTLPARIWNDVIRSDDGIPSPSANDLRASKAEAEEGTSHMKWMTPLRTREAIEAFVPSIQPPQQTTAVALPVPTLRIEITSSTIQSLARDGTAGPPLVLSRSPFVYASDFPHGFLSSHAVFLEMVVLKKRVGKTGFVVPSPWTLAPDGSQLWSWPWPRGFWKRAGQHNVCINGETRPVRINRPNHIRVSVPDERIPLAPLLNGRFIFRDVPYRTKTGNMETARLPCPLPLRSSTPSTRHAYSSTYRPLRVAFRYVIWIPPAATPGHGSFMSGPISPVLKVRTMFFPFHTDHVASSELTLPAASLAPGFNSRAHLLDIFLCQ